MTDFVLCLRTCSAGMTSHGGFTWPRKGPVSCSDWNPAPVCGGGLHGLLWGTGGPGYLSSDQDAKWLVVKVPASEVVAIDHDKVKFPRGEVVLCGTRARAVAYMQRHAPKGTNVVFGKFPKRFKRVTVGGVKAVHDKITGLTWEAAGSRDGMPHADAAKYCAALGKGWRMPTVEELLSLLSSGKPCDYIDRKYFERHGWWYWSSTPYAPIPGCAWDVYFRSGLSDYGHHDYRGCVRAVRPRQ